MILKLAKLKSFARKYDNDKIQFKTQNETILRKPTKTDSFLNQFSFLPTRSTYYILKKEKKNTFN